MIFEFDACMHVYRRSTETYVRESDGRLDDLNADEYISFVIKTKNVSARAQRIEQPHVRIDGGEPLGWQSHTLAPGQQTNLHVYGTHMVKLSPGAHKVEYYQNGALSFTAHLHLVRAWKKIMRYPTPQQIEAVRGIGRSPYISYFTSFPGLTNVTGYAIDFWIDDMDRGTYFSALSWFMDVSDLEKRSGSLSNEYADPGAGYCGFQLWDTGETAVIMSVWDVFCKDANGRPTVIRAKELYPGNVSASHKTSEGSFQQFIVKYPWQARHPYRLLMDQSVSDETGNAVLSMWVCDLVPMTWKKLIVFDLGYRSGGMRAWAAGGFLENYLKSYAGSVRNVSIANIRGKNPLTEKWIPARSVSFHVNRSVPVEGENDNYQGSYSFGADDKSFWIITSGAPGLCAPPEKKQFTVKNTAEDRPY